MKLPLAQLGLQVRLQGAAESPTEKLQKQHAEAARSSQGKHEQIQ